MTTAKKLYKEFVHKEPERTYKIRIRGCKSVPPEVAELGKLRRIEIKMFSDWLRGTMTWPKSAGALLLATPAGRLYIYDPTGSLQTYSKIIGIEYQVDKGDREGEVVYYHDFNRPFPRLYVLPDSRGKLGKLIGAYKVKSEGIVG